MLEDLRTRRDLRRAGWSTTAAGAVVGPAGGLARPSVLAAEPERTAGGVALVGPRAGASVVSIALGLAGGVGGPPPAIAVDRLVELSRRVASAGAPATGPWDQVVRRLG